MEEVVSEVTISILSTVVGRLKHVIDKEKNVQKLNAKLRKMQKLVFNIEKEFLEKQKELPDIVEVRLKEIDKALESVDTLIDQASGQHVLWTRILELVTCILPTELAECLTKFDRLFDELREEVSMAADTTMLVNAAQTKRLPQVVPPSGFVGEGIKFAHKQLKAWLTESSHHGARVVGVYGMPGVGKTALLKLVHNDFLLPALARRFDFVIWFDVPQNGIANDCMIKVLQNRIAEELGLHFSKDSCQSGRASQLFAFFEQKNFLLILDGVQQHIELVEKVGLQFGCHNQSKVLISSRNKGEVERMADKGYSLKIQTLSSEEGWELFKREADGRQKIAEQIAKECGGLPLAIKVVARALKGEDDWNGLLGSITDPVSLTKDDSIYKELYEPLKKSYGDLKDKPKICFLYCAAFPKDAEIDIETLVEIFSAEGLIDKWPDPDLMVEGLRLITGLEDRCLIECVERKPYRIKIQKSFRDLAIYVGQDEQNWLLATDQHLQFPNEEGIKHCIGISLGNNNIDYLPTSLNCPELQSLVLTSNAKLRDVPELFFSNLKSLKVLDLSFTSITSLPTSIEKLGQLKFLNLRECKSLNELPGSLGNLVNLKYLDLTDCRSLKSLPDRIRELENLKHLKLAGCYELKVDSKDISQLTSLHKLVLPVQMRSAKELESAYVEKVRALEFTYVANALDFHQEQELDLFSFWFPSEPNPSDMSSSPLPVCDSEMIEDLTNISELRELVVAVKSKIKVDRKHSWSKMRNLTIQYIHDADIDAVVEDILPQSMESMENLESLCMINYAGEKLPKCISNLQCLKELELNMCNQLRKLLGNESVPMLEILKLTQLSQLTSLCSEGLMENLKHLSIIYCPLDRLPTRMGNLKHLTIMYCPLLDTLPIGMEVLPNLKELDICGCTELKKLVVGYEGFPMLETLSLKKLHKLTSIAEIPSSMRNEKTMPKPHSLTILECPLLKNLPVEWKNSC